MSRFLASRSATRRDTSSAEERGDAADVVAMLRTMSEAADGLRGPASGRMAVEKARASSVDLPEAVGGRRSSSPPLSGR